MWIFIPIFISISNYMFLFSNGRMFLLSIVNDNWKEISIQILPRQNQIICKFGWWILNTRTRGYNRQSVNTIYLFFQVKKHNDNMFCYMMFLRITPFLPNWFINVCAPLVDVPLIPFWLGTFFGKYLKIKFIIYILKIHRNKVQRIILLDNLKDA